MRVRGSRLVAVARFASPNVWDVASGIALVIAAGGDIRTNDGGGWTRFEGFGSEPGEAMSDRDVGEWRQPVILGEAEAVELMCREQVDG